MKLFAIHDSALGAYANLMQFPSDGVAIRAFTNEVNREGSELAAHPNDYALHTIGVLDDRTGLITENTPTVLIRANQVLAA